MIKLRIPGLPKSPNQLLGAHWRTRSRHSKQWLHAVHIVFLTNGINPRIALTKAKIKLTRVSSVMPDADNLRGSFKPVMDALVKLGTIIDDNPNVVGEPEVEWVKGKPKEGYIIVQISKDE